MLEGKHVLILEDEPIIGFALEDMLISIGCPTVLMATRLDEAQKIIEANSVDAAILDVNIHGERSYSLADELAVRELPYKGSAAYCANELTISSQNLDRSSPFRQNKTLSGPAKARRWKAR